MPEEYRRLDALLDFDPSTGMKQTFHMDVDGKLTIRTAQDPSVIADIQRMAHEERMSTTRNERIGEFRRVASIPVEVQFDLIKRGIWNDKDAMKKWLNSAEAAPYRVHTMRL
jgi:hypothetical protein